MAFRTSRDLAASPAEVYAAFEDSARLAVWWGPEGFTNTFEVCEFRPQGKWVFVMHGPGGKHYPNESQFVEVVPATRIVIQHVSQPRYRLTVSLEPLESGTRVHWDQVFEDPRVENGIGHIVIPANEQNLDRLTAEVLRINAG